MSRSVRRFHVDSLPSGLLFVALEPAYGSRFVHGVLEALPASVIARIDEVYEMGFCRWVIGCRCSGSRYSFVRLDGLVKLAELLEQKGHQWASRCKLERRIVAMRAYGCSKILRDPHLPVCEDEHLVRLIVHMAGDGHMPTCYGTTDAPQYTNTSAFLRTRFLETLAAVFGDVSECAKIRSDETQNSRSHVSFSKWLGYVLCHVYPDARFGQMTASLPGAFFKLPLELKAVIVQAFGDDDGHVGPHSIRFVSGAPTILEQLRDLVLELMRATLPDDEFSELVESVGQVAACRTWFMLDLYRPLYGWFREVVGFSHPERAAALTFQLACDVAHRERGLDGFDLDFLALVGLREGGSVESLAKRFLLREDFLFRVVLRLRRLGWVKRVGKQRYITLYRTSSSGEAFLAKTLRGAWARGDRVVVSEAWLHDLREALLKRFGNAAAASRAARLPENTVRHYLEGGGQVMGAGGLGKLAGLVGWGRAAVSRGVVVALDKRLAPRYEQCTFSGKVLPSYEQFSRGASSFQEWLLRRVRPVARERQFLAVDFAGKLQTADVIRRRILSLAEEGRGEVSLTRLRGDATLRELVANRYESYLADRMAKLVQQGVFVRLTLGRYRLAASNPQFASAAC